MNDLGIVAIVVGAASIGLLLFRRKPTTVLSFNDEREENLTHRLAKTVCCTLAEALPSVRQELRMAPNQSDETLLKRAVYHFRQALPENTCSVYRDAAKG